MSESINTEILEGQISETIPWGVSSEINERIRSLFVRYS